MKANQKTETKPWQPGDPVGNGLVYLPDEKTRAAYGAECRRQIVNSIAGYVVAGRTLQERRARMSKCPRNIKQFVEERVRELWAARGDGE